MFVAKLRFVVLILIAAAISVYGHQSSPSNRPWPPGVQKVSNESPAQSAEEEMKTFFMPPGYRVELVASEPLVRDPIAIDWDTEGRLWVVEMPGFMADITGSTENDPIGRIVVLEDTNGDGRMDKRTVFADGLVLGRSVKVLERGVLVAEPPSVWLMRDTNGDVRADTKELVTNQYGRRGVDPQENANGFLWAVDNRMYTAGQADIQLRLKNGTFEAQRTLQRGEWGVSEDDAGRIYRNTNESALHVDLVPTSYFARNPSLLRTRGSYERLADDNPDLNTVWPVRPNPGTNRAYQTGIDRPDGSLAKFTSVCAPLVYRGDRLPADVYGNVFVVEPAANLVSRIVLDERDGTVHARKAYDRGEFLASTDERFRPVYVSNAPDGTLYVVDMYHGIIEHRISITEYLRDQILARKLQQPTGLGRIFRVVHETTQRDTSVGISTASPQDLVAMLSHPNGWWRDTAQRLLIERAEKSVVPELRKLAESATDQRLRLRALWILDGLDAIEPATVTSALEDTSSIVRSAAIRISERWLGEANHPVAAAVVKHIEDPDVAVRRQLAASMGTLPPAARQAAVLSLLGKYGDDPITMDATLSGLRGSEADVLEEVLKVPVRLNMDPTSFQSPPGATAMEAAITMLTATIIRSAEDSAVQRVFGAIANSGHAMWQRSALVRGAEIALLGGVMPGTRSTRSETIMASTPLPCPTCPGGRAGPGGGYAFQRPGDPTISSGRGRGRGPGLRLNREPVQLTGMASSQDELGPRVTSLLSHVTWPGKSGETVIPPLRPEEQQRFDAGRDVYRNICQACHQPDGRGQEKLAPSLIGSAFALAAPEIPLRILLNGKEGTVGLMPPIGTALTDEQIAGVLTYIRREWGQTGSPVDPATVKAVRQLTAGRTRPWTNDELLELTGGGR
jgi:mono/diheme cytochrome c family protein/glucose/arabinose dehydrogenase